MQFITHLHTQPHRHIQAQMHTYNHIHIQTDTYPPPHTHTYTKNVLSTMAEYIHCKLPCARKRVKAPIEVYTIHTHYHCIIHILHSKSMIPSRSCKTATPLWIYHRTYQLLRYIYMLRKLLNCVKLWNILLYLTLVNAKLSDQMCHRPKRKILSFRLTNKPFAHALFTTVLCVRSCK